MTTVLALLSVIIVSLLSLIGILFFSLNAKRLETILIYLVSLAAGAFFGDVFLHLIPGVIQQHGWNLAVSFYVLAGIVAFLVLEKIIHWHHCHEPAGDHHPHSFATMSLVGDGIHNFVDGVIIAASYLVSVPLGIATTIAVICHEIPQEITDFGILLYGGYSKKRALVVNLLSALTAILGAVLTLLIHRSADTAVNILIPLAIGGFIYIAGSDLVPQIQKHESLKKSVLGVLMFILGIASMAALLLLES